MPTEPDARKSCWLLHKWGPWSDPEAGWQILEDGEKRPAMIQKRRCERCNKRELASAAK